MVFYLERKNYMIKLGADAFPFHRMDTSSQALCSRTLFQMPEISVHLPHAQSHRVPPAWNSQQALIKQ